MRLIVASATTLAKRGVTQSATLKTNPGLCPLLVTYVGEHLAQPRHTSVGIVVLRDLTC
jgi:hypothetical protein